MKETIAALNQLAKDGFWGNVQIDFKDGQVTTLRKTETIKLNGDRKNLPNDTTRNQ